MVSRRAASAGERTRRERRRELREALWADVDDDVFWNPASGFAQVPRCLPQIGLILDKFSGKGVPVSSTYLSLLCNYFDEGVVEVSDSNRFASEAGFTGERAVSTWLSRLKKLETLGFIKGAEVNGAKYRYVLLMCPYESIELLYKGIAKDALYNNYCTRKLEVNAS